MMEYFVSAVILIVSFFLLYCFQKKEEQIFEKVLSQNVDNLKVLTDAMTHMQTEHFATLEKTTEKQMKYFSSYFEKVMKAQKSDVVTQYVKSKNEIDKKENEDIPFTEDVKIPITNGMHIKFEDEGDDEAGQPIVIQ